MLCTIRELFAELTASDPIFISPFITQLTHSMRTSFFLENAGHFGLTISISISKRSKTVNNLLLKTCCSRRTGVRDGWDTIITRISRHDRQGTAVNAAFLERLEIEMPELAFTTLHRGDVPVHVPSHRRIRDRSGNLSLQSNIHLLTGRQLGNRKQHSACMWPPSDIWPCLIRCDGVRLAIQ